MDIGIDSQCLSYLIDAMQGVAEPRDILAEERKALIRLYLYTPGTLYATPTVVAECAKIRSVERNQIHQSYLNVLFDEIKPHDETGVQNLLDEFIGAHAGENDCRILAEAISSNLDALVTYDSDFLRRLGALSIPIQLTSPSLLWESLSIEKGAKPDKSPHESNPLIKETWWMW